MYITNMKINIQETIYNVSITVMISLISVHAFKRAYIYVSQDKNPHYANKLPIVLEGKKNVLC